MGLAGEGPIVPFIVGENARALSLSAALWDEGVFAPAVRYPTVPKGEARVRFSVTAAHHVSDIDQVLQVVARWRQKSEATA